jgi:hypothetical protein
MDSSELRAKAAKDTISDGDTTFVVYFVNHNNPFRKDTGYIDPRRPWVNLVRTKPLEYLAFWSEGSVDLNKLQPGQDAFSLRVLKPDNTQTDNFAGKILEGIQKIGLTGADASIACCSFFTGETSYGKETEVSLPAIKATRKSRVVVQAESSVSKRTSRVKKMAKE